MPVTEIPISDSTDQAAMIPWPFPAMASQDAPQQAPAPAEADRHIALFRSPERLTWRGMPV